ncbi:Synembryn-A [Nibea albiflora]|uniref:Synembryn-A n=1 Tax=Nibea albiflora TaxID=240163 RepID=A0ACB7EWP5_NIBAL|nr:Synembryn-A [Nibea albiflora]
MTACHWAAGMVPDVERIIESIVQGDQDSVQLMLDSYNTQFRKNKVREYVSNSDSDFDSDDDEPDLLLRQRLATVLLCFISSQLQPAVLRVCLHTLRILSRDRRALGPMVTDSALLTLVHLGGISLLHACPQQEEEKAVDHPARPHRRAESGYEEVAVADATLLSISSVHSSTPVEVAGDATVNVSFHDCCKWKGDEGHVMLARGKKDTWEENSEEEEKEEDVEVCRKEAMKVLCNVIYNSSKAQERASTLRLLQGLWESVKQGISSGVLSTGQFYKLRLLFLLTALRPELRLLLQQEHGVSMLTKALEQCLNVKWGDGFEVLSDSTAPPISKEMSQEVIEILKILFNIAHMLYRQEPDEGQKLKEKLTPVLNLLTESSRVHRETRHYLRQKVLPPLRDVAIRPEQDTTLRGQLVRLMTHVDTDVKHCAAELLFVLCKENVSRFVKYTGYGNAAGLLAARGLLNGRRNSGDSQYASQYSSDSDSDTEEYQQAKARINLVTGRVEAEQPDPMEGMTEEEKEEEARRLVSMINRLSRDQIIQPMGVTSEGRLVPLWGQMRGCTLEEEEDSEEELD